MDKLIQQRLLYGVIGGCIIITWIILSIRQPADVNLYDEINPLYIN